MKVLVLSVFEVVVQPLTSMSFAPMTRSGANLPLNFAFKTSATSGSVQINLDSSLVQLELLILLTTGINTSGPG